MSNIWTLKDTFALFLTSSRKIFFAGFSFYFPEKRKYFLRINFGLAASGKLVMIVTSVSVRKSVAGPREMA